MADQENNGFDLRRDGLGLLLFASGAFALVLVVMAWKTGATPDQELEGTAALAAGLAGFLGHLPAAVWAAGFATVGALLFLVHVRLDVPRHLLGIVGSSLALAILLGAFSDVAGGRFGAALGGAVTSRLSIWVGAFVGLMMLAGPIWFAWVRGALDFSGKVGLSSPSSVASTEESEGGVSTEEANALVPDATTLAYMEELWEGGASAVKTPAPPSPYPTDIRLEGKIPPGARPLQSSDAAATVESPTPVPTGRGGVTQVDLTPDVAAGQDLVAEETGEGPAVPAAPVVGEASESGLVEAALSAPPEPPAAADSPVQVLGTDAPGAPPRPAWEQNDLFADEEPTEDAFATTVDEPATDSSAPVASWVADFAQAAGLSKTENEAGAVVPAADEEVLEEEELEEAAEYEEPSDEDEDEEEDEEEEEDEDEVEGELEDEDEEEEEDEEEGEYEEYEDEEEEDEEEEEEEDEEAAEYEDEEDEDEEEDGAEAAEYEDEEEEDDEESDEDEDEEVDEDEEYEDEEEEEEEEDEEEGEAAEYEEEEDSDESEAPEAASSPEVTPEPEPEPAAISPPPPEAEVILQPQPAPAPPAAGKRTPPADRARLVQDAGNLFLERGRVAVSLLQRSFGLDFEQSCEVLDELQQLGLIGPYIGGQARDILMTPAEWNERVLSS